MDPLPLTTEQWEQAGHSLQLLWLALACALIAGPSFLAAHAIIPSAVATRSIPEKFNKLRPIFYIVGFLGLASIITFFCLAYFNVYEVLQRIYPSFWQ